MSFKPGSCIGIDLGTSTTSAAVLKHGRYEILFLKSDSLNFDSVVAYNESSRSVGIERKVSKNRSSATVYEVKRLLGRKFKDIQKELQHSRWSYEVREGESGNAEINLLIGPPNKCISRIITPEQVSADILSYIREFALKYLDTNDIESCVITCPVQFSTEQRRATLSAGYLAGFTNVQLVAEPTAAAIAFAEKFDRTAQGERYYCVYDFGGGTFDASIVHRNGNSYRVINTAGDAFLGGKDIDVAIMEDITKRIKSRNLKLNPRRMLDFKIACKEAKERLLSVEMTDIDLVFCMWENEDDVESMSISREQLAAICRPIISKTLEVVKSVLASCLPPLTADDIDMVFLMGGSSSLRSVEEEVATLFDPSKIYTDPPFLAKTGIAIGATRIASSLDLQNQTNLMSVTPELQFVDVSPHEIRLLCGGKTEVILPHKTPIGENRSIRILPVDSGKGFARLVITAGMTDSLIDNTYLGTLKIPLRSDRIAEEQPLVVTVHVTGNDLVDVTVVDEFGRHGYHAVLNAGLSEERCNDLKRIQLARQVEERGHQEIQKLIVDISKCCDKCRLKLADSQSNVLREVEELNGRITNQNLTVEKLIAIKSRVECILAHLFPVCCLNESTRCLCPSRSEIVGSWRKK